MIPPLQGIPHFSDIARAIATASFAARKSEFIDAKTHEAAVTSAALYWGDKAPDQTGGDAADEDANSLYFYVEGLRRRVAPYAEQHGDLYRATVALAGQLKATADAGGRGGRGR